MSGRLPDDGFVEWYHAMKPSALRLARRMSGTDTAPDLVADLLSGEVVVAGLPAFSFVVW